MDHSRRLAVFWSVCGYLVRQLFEITRNYWSIPADYWWVIVNFPRLVANYLRLLEIISDYCNPPTQKIQNITKIHQKMPKLRQKYIEFAPLGAIYLIAALKCPFKPNLM